MSKRWLLPIGLSVTSALAGAWLTHLLRKATAPSSPAALDRDAPDQGAPPNADRDRAVPPPAVPLDQLRSVLREEIAGELDRRRAAEQAATPAPSGEPLPTTEQMAAFAHAVDLIQAARDHQRWSEQDRDRLRSLMQQLAPQDLAEVLHTLVPALNRGEIKIDFKGSPF